MDFGVGCAKGGLLKKARRVRRIDNRDRRRAADGCDEIGRGGGTGAWIQDLCFATRVTAASRRRPLGLQFGLRGWGDVLRHQGDGGVEEDAVGPAEGVLQDASTTGIRRVGADAGDGQGRGVDPGGMTIYALEKSGTGASEG